MSHCQHDYKYDLWIVRIRGVAKIFKQQIGNAR